MCQHTACSPLLPRWLQGRLHVSYLGTLCYNALGLGNALAALQACLLLLLCLTSSWSHLLGLYVGGAPDVFGVCTGGLELNVMS